MINSFRSGRQIMEEKSSKMTSDKIKKKIILHTIIRATFQRSGIDDALTEI